MKTERLNHSENIEINKNLCSLLNSPAIKDSLEKDSARWIAKPKFFPELNIGFLAKGKDLKSKGISIMGLHNCVGIVVAQNDSKISITTTQEIIKKSKEGEDLIAAGAKIAVITPKDIIKWKNFYQYANENKLIDNYGRRAHEMSGLERYGEDEVKKYSRTIKEIFKNNEEKLKNLGVAQIKEYKPKNLNSKYHLDLAFFGKKGELMTVPTYYLREANIENGILIEKVSKDSSAVIGFKKREVGESKIEAYLRVESLEKTWNEPTKTNSKENLDLKLGLISGGQISLWNKLHPFEKLGSIVEKRLGIDPGLDTDDLLRWLFIGESSHQRGELGKMGYSLPGTPLMLSNGAKDIGVDLLFFQRDKDKKRKLTTLKETVISIENGKKKSKIKKHNNVGAMTIVPNEWTKEEIKKYIKNIETFFRRHHPNKYVTVLAVTKEIFENWKDRGSIFTENEVNGDDYQDEINLGGKTESEIAENPIAKIAQGYWGNQKRDSDGYFFLSRKSPSIGGNIKAIIEETDERMGFHICDVGIDFNPKFASLGKITSSHINAITGVLNSLQDQMLPMIPGVIGLPYLKAAGKNCPSLLKDLNNPVYGFLRSELASRLDDEEIEKLGISPKELREKAVNNIEEWQKGKIWELLTIIAPHAHWDHVGNMALLGMATIIASPETTAELSYLTSKNARWYTKPEYLTLITEKREKRQGSPYKFEKRPSLILNENEKLKIGSNLDLEGKITGHSIPGAMMQLFTMNEQKILLTGDLRLDDHGLTRKAIKAFSGKAETIVIETTNGPNVEKASSGVKEKEIRENLKKEIGRSKGEVIFIVTPPNHVERIDSIIKAAEYNGRKVAMTGKHLEILYQLKFTNTTNSIDDQKSFPYQLPSIGEDVAYWLPHLESLKNQRSYEKALFEMSQHGKLGVVDIKRLTDENGDWVIIVDPYNDIISKTNGLHAEKRIKLIWSSYNLYKPEARELACDMARKLIDRADGSELIADYSIPKTGYRVRPGTHPRGPFHASGHVKYSEMVNDILLPLLGPHDSWSDKTIILTHGKNPYQFSQSLKASMEKEAWKMASIEKDLNKKLGEYSPRIIWQLARYDSRNPLDDKNPIGLNAFTHKWA